MMNRRALFGLGGVLLYVAIVFTYSPSPSEYPLPLPSLAQYLFSNTPLKKAEIHPFLPALKARYGLNKNIPPDYTLPFYTAMNFFPELYEAHITVSSKDLPTSMRAKPTTASLLNWNRHYCIDVNDQSTKVVDLSKASFSELTGCFIHELAHIKDYETQSNGSIAVIGIRYFFSQRFKSQLEKKTDELAIAHGGGYYLYQFADFIHNRANADSAYLKNKQANYYSPADLKRLFEHHAH